MEVKVIGQMDNTIDHTFESTNRVYNKNGLAPTVNTCGGGGLQPKIIQEPVCLNSKGGRGGIDKLQPSLQDRVYRTDAVSVAVTTCYMPSILEDKTIVAMRGRYTGGSEIQTEQRLEPNMEGVSNTLTSVQKDNLVMEKVVIDDTYANRQPRVYEDYCPTLRSEREGLKTVETILTKGKQIEVASTILAGYERTNITGFNADNGVVETVRIKQATSQGYIECEVGGVADLSYPESKTRRGRVQENGQVSPTLMAGEQDICRIETYSPYVNQKYKEFQEENGYIPEYFNPYNKTDLKDIAPTLTAQGESVTKSSTVLKCDTQYRIRKLTPRECWRLMDFTDEDFEKAAQVNSNTQLYRQAGNSIVKNVLVAIIGQMLPGKENIYKEN